MKSGDVSNNFFSYANFILSISLKRALLICGALDLKALLYFAIAINSPTKNDNVTSGGRGISRQWSDDEIEELLLTGKVKGYHMKSVMGYPKLAGDPTNIQFLTPQEHLMAHGGNWRNLIHGGYYG